MIVIKKYALVLTVLLPCVLGLSACIEKALAPEVKLEGGVQSLPPFEQAKTAVVNGDLEFVKSCVESDPRYIEAFDDNYRTLLHFAAGADQVAIAKYLIENGAYVNVDDVEGFLPFDAAVQEGASDAMKDLLRDAGMREAGMLQ